MHNALIELTPRILQGMPLSREQAAALPPLLPGILPDLMALARLAASAGGARPFICGLASAKSGRCPEDCVFCAQSTRYRTESPVFPLKDCDSLLRRAEELSRMGARYMGMVISGTGPDSDELERLCACARRILARVDISLCASFGLLNPDQALALKDAGFSSCHHNLESAPSYYSKICTSHGIEKRLETLRNAAQAGLRLCSGGVFGLGESWEQRLELAEVLGHLRVHSIAINFLNPIPGTPLESSPPLPAVEALAVIALFRLMHPGLDIVICGGRPTSLGEHDALIFSAGANALISGEYLTTHGSAFDRDRAMLAALGLDAESTAQRGATAK